MAGLPTADERVPDFSAGSRTGFQLANGTKFKPRVVLVDDRALTRECLLRVLWLELGRDIEIEAFASLEAVTSEDHTRFDLLLLRVHGTSPSILRAQIMSLASVSMQSLVITSDKTTDMDLSFADLLHNGVCGLVSESESDSRLLGAAIKFALCGGKVFPMKFAVPQSSAQNALPVSKKRDGLTVRQSQVFAKMQEGKPNKIIAFELGISQSTTKVHVQAILRRTGATNRTQAAILRHNGLDSASRFDPA